MSGLVAATEASAQMQLRHDNFAVQPRRDVPCVPAQSGSRRMSKTIHLVISVRGMLNWPIREAKRNLKWITKEDGTRYTSVDELRNALMDELAKGHEVLKTGECDNHDWKKGCLGHDTTEQED